MIKNCTESRVPRAPLPDAGERSGEWRTRYALHGTQMEFA